MNLHKKNKWLAFGAALALGAALTACGDEESTTPSEWMDSWSWVDSRTEHIETSYFPEVYLMTYDPYSSANDTRIDVSDEILIDSKGWEPESDYVEVIMLISGSYVNENSVGYFWFGDDSDNVVQFTNGDVIRIGEGVQVSDGKETNQVLHLEYDECTYEYDSYYEDYMEVCTPYFADYDIRKTYTAEQPGASGEWADTAYLLSETAADHAFPGGLAASGTVLVKMPESNLTEYPQAFVSVDCGAAKDFQAEVPLGDAVKLGSYDGESVYGITLEAAGANATGGTAAIDDFTGCSFGLRNRAPYEILTYQVTLDAPDNPCLPVDMNWITNGWVSAGECGAYLGDVGTVPYDAYLAYLMTYNGTDPSADQVITNEDDGVPDVVIAQRDGQPESAYADVVMLIRGPGVDPRQAKGLYWFGDDEAGAKEFTSGDVLRIGDGLQVDDGGEKTAVLHLGFDVTDAASGETVRYTAAYQVQKTYSTAAQ